MPISINPFTFFTYRTAVIIIPIIAKRAQIPVVLKFSVNETMVTSVES